MGSHLIRNYMNSRKILTLIASIALVGCSFNNLLFNRAIESLRNQSEISIDYYRDLSFASLLVELNNNQFVVILGDANKNRSRWFSSDNTILVTRNYKVIAVDGFENDFTMINPPSIKQIYLNLFYSKGSNIESHNGYISFTNPKTSYLEINFSYTLDRESSARKLLSSGKEGNVFLLTEQFEIPLIRRKGKNYYWFDKNGIMQESKQEIISIQEKIRLSPIKYSKLDN